MDRQNFENQVFDELPSIIICSNFFNCTFNASTKFDRCNLFNCIFNIECEFEKSNIINDEIKKGK